MLEWPSFKFPPINLYIIGPSPEMNRMSKANYRQEYPLHGYTEKGYLELKNSGMMWVWYPEATGSYQRDVVDMRAPKEEVLPEKDPLDVLIDDHWGYIESLLLSHNESEDVLEAAKFHYKSAFRHGWKHAKEDSNDE